MLIPFVYVFYYWKKGPANLNYFGEWKCCMKSTDLTITTLFPWNQANSQPNLGVKCVSFGYIIRPRLFNVSHQIVGVFPLWIAQVIPHDFNISSIILHKYSNFQTRNKKSLELFSLVYDQVFLGSSLSAHLHIFSLWIPFWGLQLQRFMKMLIMLVLYSGLLWTTIPIIYCCFYSHHLP